MAARTCILLAILGFVIVHMGALFQGHPVSDVWIRALLVMISCGVLGFFLGWAYEALIKEVLIQEETLMYRGYLETHHDAHGDDGIHRTVEQEVEESGNAGESNIELPGGAPDSTDSTS